MFDYSGIVYRTLSDGGLILIINVFLIIITKITDKKKKQKDKKTILCALVGIVISFVIMFYNGWWLLNPSVEFFDGEFRSYNHARIGMFVNEYVFIDENNPDPVFTLDAFSKRKIYNEDFQEGVTYRIYYESHSKIIVRVEKIG